jgi:hypothetical protein
MKIIYLILITALSYGCASESFSTGATNLSQGTVDRALINGKTTKADVISLLGEPQSTVSGNFSGVKVDTWAYAKTFYHSAAAEKGFGEALIHGMDNDRIGYCYLSITFDSHGWVTGHTFGKTSVGAQ